MKYTKEERKEIYLKAISLLRISKKNTDYCCCCDAISMVITDNRMYGQTKEEDFPELFLFEQNLLMWFGSPINPYNQKTRHIVLLLCAEMCNDN